MRNGADADMSCIVFPHDSWGHFPFQELIRSLAAEEPCYYVCDENARGADSDSGSGTFFPSPCTLEQCLAEHRRPELVIVTHPYWVIAAASLYPERLVVMLPDGTYEEQEPYWSRCVTQAAGCADLFAAASESRYLEYAFKYRSVWLLRESGMTGDAYAAALLQAVRGADPHSCIRMQQQALMLRYAALREQMGAHETVSFLLSVYEYLLGMPGAEEHAQESFLHAVQQARTDCLTTHYRFVSAILAERDELAEAVDAFGATACSDTDKSRYEELCRLLEQNRRVEVKAQLLRYNDDYAGALAALERGLAEDVPLRMRLQLERGDREGAAALLPQLQAEGMAARRDSLLLQGAVRQLRGDRIGAIRLLLEAAEIDSEAIQPIAEIKAEDQAVRRLRQYMKLRAREESGANRHERDG
ncbi:MAG: hypothetical protein K0Q59_245 [Paenibacillus sp.]|jgi:hypothetical protein|nr:hypothetical protein [Paenibacillus sp.]